VSQSPRFSALLIGLRSLGFVGALWARRTLVPVPRLAPLLLWRCARGGPLPYTEGAPDQGADLILAQGHLCRGFSELFCY
jgi:hypothetical protein